MAIKDVSTILNSIREMSSNAYQTAVPMATATNLTDVGNAVLGLSPSVQNEFIYAVNKIALTTIDAMDFKNPLEYLKKGKLEYGATVEDLFIQTIESIPYVAGTRSGESAPDQFEIFKVDNKAAFYSTQLERQYPYTVHRNDLKRAFRSSEGFKSWLGGLVKALISSENWDDYRLTVALIARQVEAARSITSYKGEIKLVTDFNALFTKTLTAETALKDKDFLTYFVNQVKKYSGRLKFPRDEFNIAKVKNTLPKERQRLMMLQDVKSDIDTYLLAGTYNMEKLDIGGFDEIDAWYSIGVAPSGGTSSPEDIEIKGLVSTTGDPVLGVLYDSDMTKIYNAYREQSSAPNARGLYETNYLTVADIFAASPFTNFVVFTLA